MTRKEIKELKLLKEKISYLEIVECGMVHEKVKFNENKNPIRLGTENYLRNSLCPKHIRNNRIGCGHTMVRAKLKEVLNLLANVSGKTEDIKELRAKLNKLDIGIGTVDHKKGHLENEYAAARENNNENELSNINKRINNTIKLHNRYLEECKEFRNDLVQLIEVIISENKPGSIYRKIFTI